MATVGSYGGGISYERGTPAIAPRLQAVETGGLQQVAAAIACVLNFESAVEPTWYMQGYLAYKKPPPRGILQ